MVDWTKEDWTPNLCLYHGNCSDGFGAAWAIHKRWPNCEFVPCFYGKELPEVDGKDVLFVDFSAPIDWIWKHSSKSRSMVIIDHHKTAREDLERLVSFNGTMRDLGAAFRECWSQNGPEIAAWFDMEQSGAVMAWEFAHPNKPVPWMLKYIEDRDLWRDPPRYGDTKYFSAAIWVTPRDFAVWDAIEDSYRAVIEEGQIILRANDYNVRQMLKQAYLINIGGHLVPAVNTTYHFASDVGNELLKQEPTAPFAATWFRRPDGYDQWSLRSEHGRVDVSEVAKTYGGGGHRNASGFQAPAAWNMGDAIRNPFEVM